MQKHISTAPFQGTAAQKDELLKVIDSHRDDPGAILPILQEAQEIYGYLPLEVQKIISDELGVSLEEIYGVSTFYSQFSLTPKGKYHISVCLGTACYVKGAQNILDRITSILKIHPEECTEDRMFSLTACRCIGACGLAPVLTINDDVYGRLTADDIDGIIKKYQEA